MLTMMMIDAIKVGKNETEIVIPLKYLSSFWRA